MSSGENKKRNVNYAVVRGFGDEWGRYDQSDMSHEDYNVIFNDYFDIFPWSVLPENSVGFDLGCGSGRWAKGVCEKVGTLHCIDPSSSALNVAKNNLSSENNCVFHEASVDEIPLEDNSVDFGYSLGVLHHVPDTQLGINSCVEKLKPGAPFLVYLYYSFDNRPAWYRAIWKTSEILRAGVSKSPFFVRRILSELLAFVLYFPFARFALLVEKLGGNPANIPLNYYRNLDYYVMRTDARDRFGTTFEQRFSKRQIHAMMENAGLENIVFGDKPPFWHAVGYKK